MKISSQDAVLTSFTKFKACTEAHSNSTAKLGEIDYRDKNRIIKIMWEMYKLLFLNF